MYISRFKLANFKSYKDSPVIEFTPGLNIVVGQNNAGKSTLLESLKLTLPWNPHKSHERIPFEGAPPIAECSLNVSFSMSRSEMLDVMSEKSKSPFNLPYPESGTDFARSINFIDDSKESHARLADSFLSHESYTFQMKMNRTNSEGPTWSCAAIPSFGLYPKPSSYSGWNGRHARYFFDAREQVLKPFGAHDQITNDIGFQLVSAFSSRIYVFGAERFNIGEAQVGNSSVLLPNATNLPAVLNVLQGNRSRFERFNSNVRSILPQIHWVSTRPTANNGTIQEILVWPFDPKSERQDLTIPLKDSGTGVGQVLAMLYVVLTTTRPSTIIIDEPQSFLHPGAARKLIELLRIHSEHQYIIATHSPSIISAADPQTITVARLDSGETVLEQVNVKDGKVQEALLAELGARLPDVFGSDNILWVEGQTEEICYRRIFHELAGEALMGTQILGVRQTGDLEGDSAERIIEIYNKISSSNSMIPVAVGFLLDSECLSEQKKKELKTKSKNLLRFLPRRMYENYLLHPSAIAEVATAIDGFAPQRILANQVSAVAESTLADSKYYCDGIVPQSHEDRIGAVHAKKVLRVVFSELSETRVRYDEIVHGAALTEWLLANAPAELQEIVELLRSMLVQRGPSNAGPV